MIKKQDNRIYCCKDCGNVISLTTALYGSGRCYFCFNTLRIKDKCACIDCRKILNTRDRKIKRCIDCYRKFIKVQDQFCIDCGKKLNKYRKALRCYVCNGKFNRKNPLFKTRLLSSIKKPILLVKKQLKIVNLYIRGVSAPLIAKKYNVVKSTIYRILRKHRIKIKSNSESHKGIPCPIERKEKYKKLFKGKGNPNWRGGLDKEGYPYYFSDELKYKIRERDNFTCQYCNLKEKNHFHGNKNVKLTVHHIDYNKQNCKEDNLMALCTKCNFKVNGQRDYWYAYFRYMLDNQIKL